MLYGPILGILLHPSTVSGLFGARGILGFFCAFGRLLGMLRSLFAHGASHSRRLQPRWPPTPQREKAQTPS
jgi:hypothetical protein